MIEPQLKTLDNGARSLVLSDDNVKTATVMVLIKAGSHYESATENGLSHFLEHACFKGAGRYENSRDITETLDSLGAAYNAFTSREYTGYYAKGRSDNLEELFNVIGDVALKPHLPEDELEKEKGVIVEEINMYNDDPMSRVDDLFTELMYQGSAYSRPIIGNESTVRSFTPASVREYHNQYYQAGNCLVIVSGNVSSETVQALASKLEFTQSDNEKNKLETFSAQDSNRVAVLERPIDQTHLILGVESYDMSDERKYAQSVLSGVLGSGMSSRLFKEMREKRGLSYYQGSTPSQHQKTGTFEISAGVNSQKTTEVVELMIQLCKELTTDLVLEEELKRVKAMILGQTALALESTHAQARFYGMQELLKGEMVTLSEYERRIEAVSSEQVKAVAADLFTAQRYRLAVLGPNVSNQDFESILD